MLYFVHLSRQVDILTRAGGVLVYVKVLESDAYRPAAPEQKQSSGLPFIIVGR